MISDFPFPVEREVDASIRVSRELCAIYVIYNVRSKNVYVGKGIGSEKRLNDHLVNVDQYSDRRHRAEIRISEDADRTGMDALRYGILELCPLTSHRGDAKHDRYIRDRERYWIDKLQANYNVTKNNYPLFYYQNDCDTQGG